MDGAAHTEPPKPEFKLEAVPCALVQAPVISSVIAVINYNSYDSNCIMKRSFIHILQTYT